MIYLKKILIILLIIAIPLSIFIFTNLNNNKDTPVNSDNNLNNISKLDEIINKMSIEEKVGQMFMVRCPIENAIDYVNKYHLGGYILYGRDFANKTKEEVIENINSYQNNASIPLFIGVDEEGGKVTRVSSYQEFRSEPFKSPQELYQEGGFERITEDTLEKGALLTSLGINVNFAPVSDVSTDPTDYIYARSFGQDATLTSEYVSVVVTAMKEANIASVLKHFPGYGNNVDTHTGISIDTRDYETFLTSDFIPFTSGITAGADMVLVSHNIVTSIDPDYPASLSKKVHDILRDDLDFTGVIITDDLYMDAIKDYQDNEEVAVIAILAGNDLICTTDFETQIPAVIKAVEEGIINVEQINDSVRRILTLKDDLGLI